MTAISLYDAVLSGDPTIERSRRLAQHLIQTALADISQIERLDTELMPNDVATFDRETAELVRKLYEDWAEKTDALLNCLIGLQKRSKKSIDNLSTLCDAHGRVMAMLSVSLDDVEEANNDLLTGNTISIEEIRREFGLGIHKKSEAGTAPSGFVASGGDAR